VTRARATRGHLPATVVPAVNKERDWEVEWTRLKSVYTPYLDYRHLCAYELQAGCSNCAKEKW